MARVRIEDAGTKTLGEVVDQVCRSQEPIVVTGPSGDLVRVVPVPKPVRFRNGRSVYRIEDAQHRGFPYWSDEKDKQ